MEKLEVAAVATGVATAALEDAWTYAHERKQFNKLPSNQKCSSKPPRSVTTDLAMVRN